ncbi:MAG: hypothetical protein ACKOYP_09320, partial [Bacteroidota bacterium]
MSSPLRKVNRPLLRKAGGTSKRQSSSGGIGLSVFFNRKWFTSLQFYFFLGLLTFSNCNEEEKVKPLISFESAASTVTEGEEVIIPFNIPLPKDVEPVISLSGNASQTADYTYTLSEGGLTFNAVKDKVKDPDETIVVTITAIRGTARLGTIKSHTITIKEPVLPIVAFSAPASSAAEGGTQLVPFKSPLPADVVPVFSVKGTAGQPADFTYLLTAEGIVIASKTDQEYDPNETIVISLYGVSDNAELGADSVHTVTLTEAPLIVEFASPSSTVKEGSGDLAIPFNMVLPAAVVPVVTLEGTATDGVDFTYSVSSSGIVFKPLTDELAEPDETVVITLSGLSGNAVSGSQKKHTVTITEAPSVIDFAEKTSTGSEGSTKVVAFSVPVPTGSTPSISFAGTAIPAVDY